MSRRNQSQLDESITIPVDADFLETMRKLADDERRKLAPMARILLEEALDARGIAMDDEARPSAVESEKPVGVE